MLRKYWSRRRGSDFSKMRQPMRELLLNLYRWISTIPRWQRRCWFESEGQAPSVVLYYHRVANDYPNPWTITRENFAAHLDWFAANFQFVSLDEIVRSQESGTRSKCAVHITFDDGYGENCQWAIPELVTRRIPVTYFTSTDFVESGAPFPHDVERGIPLRPNSIEEVRQMADQGIVIGGHTASHISLGQILPRQVLDREIRDVRKKLQDWTGTSVDYFAFPYGGPEHITQPAIDMIFESGYMAFVSACGGYNFPGKDSFHIQRIHGDPGMAALKNWLTFDSRKLQRRCPIQYEMPHDYGLEHSKDITSIQGSLESERAQEV